MSMYLNVYRANKEEYYISSYFARPSIASDFTNEVTIATLVKHVVTYDIVK